MSGTDSRRIVALLAALRSPRGQSDPAAVYRRLRAHGEVVASPWGGPLLTSYAACDQVLRDRNWLTLDAPWRRRQGKRWTSPASAEFGEMLMVLNPPDHTLQRRVLGSAFDRAALARLRETVSVQVTGLLDDLEQQLKEGTADFAATVGEELPVAAVGSWLAIPPADFPLLRRLTHEQTLAQELFPTAAQLATADRAALELRSYFEALVDERRRHPGDDVVSGWLRLWQQAAPEQSPDVVRRLAMFTVMAGLETTTALLNSAVWLLGQHPDQADWLRYHVEGIPGAVEEILRYDPPVHVVTRVASRGNTLSGTGIHEGQLVYAMIASAQHDPDFISDPARFDVRRPAARHLAFGQGPHYCLGAGLARLEAAVLLEQLLPRFPRLRLAEPPQWEPRVAFRRMRNLLVTA
ncbi:cytochrome P450 [Streptomyces triticagri]|uniref:cytochrome P450 n=1 Tax=Streptomyces triticagri TaxID=2293568 RepID=UPI001F464E4B|nr:cytochrome P450 [Streptomyces triticagri]